ncbi:MAG TPA: hypothetical protein VLH61_11820 [Bacteroidales bacterium]|nr:hypothetical protein [Bacteroidales bacterium]
MTKKFRLLILVSLAILGLHSNAAGQFFIWGQSPGSIRWQQINTENFQVIFPEGFEYHGAYVADVLEYAYEHGSRTLGHRPRRVSVLLHNQTVVPNGFVSWAPRRIEMFTNPPQSNDSHDWLEQLAIHEFRHVVQIDKLNQGLTRVLSFIFGEQATGAIFGLFIPMWFVEGDAVAIETGLSPSGRGRLPVFEQGLRAQVLERGLFSFDKAFFGSYRDWVPSFYSLGYQMISYARENYGPGIFDSIVSRVGHMPVSLRPFSNRLRRYAGMSSDGLFQRTFLMLDSAWREQDARIQPSEFNNLNSSQPLYTEYRYPAFANDTIIVALKTGLREIPQVVALYPDGRERRLFFTGMINAHGLTAGAGKVVWSELRTNARWEHLSWSEVHEYCMETGERRRLTHKTRFFAPALSPDGSMIAVAEATDQYRFSLVILKAENGEEISRKAMPGNDFLMTPAWHPDNRTLAAVALNESGKRIVMADAFEGSFREVFDAGHVEIARPSFTRQGDLLFTGAFSGLEAIYKLSFSDNSVSKMVTSRFGARHAIMNPEADMLVWQEYSSTGYSIAKAPLNQLMPGTPLDEVDNHSVRFYNVIAEQEAALVTRSNVPRFEREVSRFRRLPNLLRLHSWSPFFLDVGTQEVGAGAALHFQDLLSTSVMTVGYQYDLNERLGRFSLNYDYFGWFPVVGLNASTGPRYGFYRRNNQISSFLYRENNLSLGLRLPLWFRRYEWIYSITPSLRLAYTNIEPTRESPGFFMTNNMYSMQYRLFVSRQIRSVARDIRPRWAHFVDLNYRHTPFGGAYMGSVFAVRASGFFPGLFRHHSLRLSAAWQRQWPGTIVPNTINLRHPNLIPYPRGLTPWFNEQTTVFSADYAFPLLYPDLSIPGFMYLQRITANMFFDQAFIDVLGDPLDPVQYMHFNSYGIELTGNFHLLRFYSPINLGVRIIMLQEIRGPDLELIWGINF